ncbi:MAG TPA: AMP-binding protein [Dongiaceae bacterium]|nr:AMP-binding protein [Dongiaceae bacterium]
MIQKSISAFFAAGRAATDIVAFADRANGGELDVDVVQFQRDIAWNAARLKSLSCRQALLVCADTYWAAVGLLALFHAGAEVAMPPGARPDSLGPFRRPGDLVVTDRDGPSQDAVFLLEAGQGDASSLAILDPDRCYLDLFTSGSTGAPKRVGKSLAQLETEAQTVETVLSPQLSAATRIHATVPHHHLYGLTFGLVWPLLSGRPFNRRPHEIWETVFASNLGDAVLVTSPAHLTRLAGFNAVSGAQRPAIILSAGAALPVGAAAEALTILGRSPTEIFGSTETGAVAIRSWRETDAPWSPLPGVAVAQSADGRLSVRSPFIAGTQPYLGADLIAIQPDGRFRALGRADDICKIEGKRISLSAVETQLRQLSGIAEAAALLIDDGQPRLAAVVKLDAAGAAEHAKWGSFRYGQLLRRRLSVNLDTASLPKRWRFVAEMPAHAMGKRRRADLAALFLPSAATASEADEPPIRERRQTAAEGGAPRLELDLFIDPALPQLEGHFPGLPIVPGVALVDWAARFAARHLQLGDGVARMLQVKFRRLITPGTVITLTLERQPAPERQPAYERLTFSYRHGEQVLASGRFSVLAG